MIDSMYMPLQKRKKNDSIYMVKKFEWGVSSL
jgi:hypothetical protein